MTTLVTEAPVLSARLFGVRFAPQTVFEMKPEAAERPLPVLRWTPASPSKLICSINYSKHHLPGEGSSSITVTHNKTCSTEHYSISEWAKHGIWCPGLKNWKINKSLVLHADHSDIQYVCQNLSVTFCQVVKNHKNGVRQKSDHLS